MQHVMHLLPPSSPRGHLTCLAPRLNGDLVRKEIMTYACFYYSATGNTARAVDRVRRALEATGATVTVVGMRKGMAIPDLTGVETLIIAFPVLSFAPPVFVRKLLRRFPRGAVPAHVLAVDGGGGGSAASVALRILARRGYAPGMAARATYPDNWVQVIEPPSPERAAELTALGDSMVDDFVGDLAGGTPARHPARKPNAGDALMGLLFGTVGRRFLGKLFFADGDCDACGLCVRRCPAGAVVLGRRRRARPFWKLSCEDCNACMNLCPKRAVNTSWARMILFLALIVAAIWVGTGVYYRFARPAIAPALTPALATVVDIVIVTLIILASHLLPIWLVDTFLLRFLQHLPGVRKVFSWTFTKSFRRYGASSWHGMDPAAR